MRQKWCKGWGGRRGLTDALKLVFEFLFVVRVGDSEVEVRVRELIHYVARVRSSDGQDGCEAIRALSLATGTEARHCRRRLSCAAAQESLSAMHLRPAILVHIYRRVHIHQVK